MSDGMDATKSLHLRRHGTALLLAGLVVGMAGLAFASVPLYRLFCQVTGYGGTSRVAIAAPAQVLDRFITVQFNADTARGMPWRFAPVQRQVKLRLGEETLAFYRAHNPSPKSVTGSATFNVTPHIAGPYFNKIECFCFTEQTLAAGQSADMPVSFFIDPDIVNDRDLEGVDTITLSYTFFARPPAADGEQ
ncbi:MAG: cytochrome c oxidase assembly protein [Alphaproteobacteria bacterium]|jgi:cytochrome c oxidase assembly protein subunit 11|nr:cytochrome c oxidase assembly protein [Alphaproteobacteria bacterium]HJP20889.1 cytochrome c oxidase assembly protein [Alphaproteobacteria bacterium]